MARRKKTTILLIEALLITIVLQAPLFAEYNRATGEDELILVSTSQEVRMGKSLSKNVEEKFGLDEDPLVQKHINEIGQKIAEVCDRRDIRYHFKVIVGEKLEPEQRINAFALPGGYVYIFKDLLQKLQDDDEIAAVISHEVGHICAKHNIKRLQGSLGALALQIIASRAEADNETRARANNAINLMMLSYSREDELAADKLSVKYAKLAGYDPEGAVRVVDMMIETYRKSPIKKYTGYHTHPYMSERKAMIRKEIHGQMAFDDYINLP